MALVLKEKFMAEVFLTLPFPFPSSLLIRFLGPGC